MNSIFKISSVICFIAALVFFSGCADNSATVTDKIAPTITADSPVSGSTITYGKTEISYTVSDDQGVKYVDVYAFEKNSNSKVYEGRFTFTNGAKPTIYFILDSAKTVGKSIYYYLIAADVNGNMKQSATNDSIYVARVLTAPPPPYSLTVQRLYNSRTINIFWLDSSKTVTSYEIQRKIGTTGTFTTFQTLSAGYFNTNDYNVDTTKTYYYRIRSKNEIGSSDFSNESNSSGSGGSGNIPAPTNLTLTPLGSTKIGISWKNNTTSNFNRIERTEDGGEFYKVVDVSSTATSYTDAYNLAAYQKYYYRIKVFSGNDSAWSKEESVTTLPFDLPKPTNFSAKIDSSTSKKKVHLAWKTSSNQFEYTDIERRTISTSYSVIGQFLGYMSSNAYTYDDTTVTGGVLYYYRVRTINDQYGVKSDYSDEATISFNASKIAITGRKK